MKSLLFKIAGMIYRVFLGIILLTFVYLLAAVLLGLVPVNRSYEPPESGIDLYIYSNGLHTDLVLPAINNHHNWRSLISPGSFPGSVEDAPYIGFGWGEKEFYLHTPTWRQLKIPIALRAVFLPSEAAMHITYYTRPPSISPKCRRIKLTPRQYEKLRRYIKDSFKFRSGQVIPIPASGYTSHDSFFEATGSYHLFNTSNSWTARGLRKIGVRSPLWSPFDFGIFMQLKKQKRK